MFAIFASDPNVDGGLNLDLVNKNDMKLFRRRLALYINRGFID